MSVLLEDDPWACPLCLEQFDTNLETFVHAQARRTQYSISRRPLLPDENRLPVSCAYCGYTFCNTCLHRLMYRRGGFKCPICPYTGMTVVEPPVNVSLVRHLLSSKASHLVGDESTAQASDGASQVNKNPKKTKMEASKKDKKKTAQEAEKTKTTFEVHSIVGVRIHCRRKEYRVHWLGYSEEEDTWECWSQLKHLDISFRRQMKQLDALLKKRHQKDS